MCPALKSPLVNPNRIVGLLAVVLTLLAVSAASGQIAENNPRLALPARQLQRPYNAPVFITGHLGFGGSFQYGHGEPNYGASIVFRPGSSANFLNFLHNLHSAMVLRLDHQRLGLDGRIFSGDLIFRRYFSDRGSAETEVLPFVGLGLGASDVNAPPGDGAGNSRYWSYLAEAGQEWYFRPNVLVVARFQYRLFNYGDVFVSTWTVSGAIGIPVPW